jgi:hypothetical protein
VNILQAPKLTLFNGQTAQFNVTDQQYFVTEVTVAQAGGQVVSVPRNEPFTLGLQMAVQPLVSADRRFVTVHLKLNLSNLASSVVPLFPVNSFLTPVFEGGATGQPVPFKQFIQQPRISVLALEKSLKIPDGGTVLLGDWKRPCEGRQESGPPALSNVPYVNRLFKTVSDARDTEHVFVMVRPRVLIKESEEVRATGAAPKGRAAGRPITSSTPDQDVLIPAPKEGAAVLLVPPPALPPIPLSPPPPFPMPLYHDRPVTVRVLAVEPAQPAPDAKGKARDKKIAKLLAKYQKACAAGHVEDAKRLARQALALDPTCFRVHPPQPAGKKAGADTER